jgi:hypothetical protein
LLDQILEPHVDSFRSITVCPSLFTSCQTGIWPSLGLNRNLGFCYGHEVKRDGHTVIERKPPSAEKLVLVVGLMISAIEKWISGGPTAGAKGARLPWRKDDEMTSIYVGFQDLVRHTVIERKPPSAEKLVLVVGLMISAIEKWKLPRSDVRNEKNIQADGNSRISGGPTAGAKGARLPWRNHYPSTIQSPTLTIDDLYRRFHNKPSPFTTTDFNSIGGATVRSSNLNVR